MANRVMMALNEYRIKTKSKAKRKVWHLHNGLGAAREDTDSHVDLFTLWCPAAHVLIVCGNIVF